MKKVLLLSLICGSVVLTGCAREKTEYTVENWDPITSEASMYCVQEGHQIERSTENGIRVTNCKLSEDEKYEIWEYYKMSHDQENTEK